MKGLLVRVGIDSTDGCWNAPMRQESGEFAYITITEPDPPRDGLSRNYDDFAPAVARFGEQLPWELRGKPTHLDPDFQHLTYGDREQRAARIRRHLKRNDLIVFFAALRPVDGPSRPLVYAIIGLYIVTDILSATEIPQERWAENAHTRCKPASSDIVVRAQPGVSGRLRKCIPIGEQRDGAYRVCPEFLEQWDGLDVKNGFIQRSVCPPLFNDADRFYRWFQAQKPELVAENNPGPERKQGIEG